MNHFELEHGCKANIDFDKLSSVAHLQLIPAVVQEITTKDILILAYTNKIAIEASLQTKIATFWSSSRNELWVKGATSGETLELVEIRINCEQNSVLYLVKINHNGACHVKNKHGKPYTSCYYRKLESIDTLSTLDIK